jgi:YbbR domain-containing protein
MIKIVVKSEICIRLFCFLLFIFLFSACSSENDSTTTKTTTTVTSQNLTAYQWHLVNTGQTAFSSTAGTAGMDINPTTIFNMSQLQSFL